MRLEQLEYFLAAAEHRSFSAAANALLMAQPSMSEQIRRLEAELGVPLFVRAGRGVELTDAGRLFVPHAERVLAEAREAVEAVREVGGREAVRIEVADDGPGMTPDVADRIFEPFFTTKAQGSGLGLAIVRKIVDAHDGQIDLDTAAGRGTRIRITLPVSGSADAD